VVLGIQKPNFTTGGVLGEYYKMRVKITLVQRSKSNSFGGMHFLGCDFLGQNSGGL
jgi:hypothetical protein